MFACVLPQVEIGQFDFNNDFCAALNDCQHGSYNLLTNNCRLVGPRSVVIAVFNLAQSLVPGARGCASLFCMAVVGFSTFVMRAADALAQRDLISRRHYSQINKLHLSRYRRRLRFWRGHDNNGTICRVQNSPTFQNQIATHCSVACVTGGIEVNHSNKLHVQPNW